MSAGWIGVDLDGTLAVYTGWQGELHIGTPVPAMLFRVKKWVSEGRMVKIVTARVAPGSSFNRDGTKHDLDMVRKAIVLWCLEHVGAALPVTHEKDYAMIELWDDRCVQVEANTGRRMDGRPG